MRYKAKARESLEVGKPASKNKTNSKSYSLVMRVCEYIAGIARSTNSERDLEGKLLISGLNIIFG